MQSSNVQCFLNCTTPVVPSQFLSKTEALKLNRLWHPWEREKVEFFTLGDLWNSFDEWSAYGAGVPISADAGEDEKLTQYYAPYLSAIQIFTSSSSLNYIREDVDSETFSDWLSDESESEKLSRWDGDGSSSEGQGVCEHENLLHFNDRLGSLYFQYFETSTPYARLPLSDQICILSEKYPGLMSLRSVDLSPASWMAVAWYPIYHIPMGRTIKGLSTCFLTYHTLSSSFEDSDNDDENGFLTKKENGEGMRVSPFAVATYKLQGDLWISGKDQEKLVSLLNVAGCWLRQLNVHHHDFNHFVGYRCG